MGLVKKIGAFITKDVKDANETKKIAIMSRMACMVMLLYFAIQSLFFIKNGNVGMLIRIAIFFGCHCLTIYLTYATSTKYAVIFLQLVHIYWIGYFVIMLGWWCGVQHFIFVLLVFTMMATFWEQTFKIATAVALCAFRLVLYGYTLKHPPILYFSESDQILFQIINTVAVFSVLTVVVMMFSKDSMKMEKKLMDYNKKIQKLACTDPLTMLCNRRSAIEYITELTENINKSDMMINIAIGDVDFFKKVNDTYGHEAGDEILKVLSEIFEECMKKKGLVSRWGGEEFLFIIEDMNGDEARIVLEEIREKVSKTPFLYNGQELRVTMTFGLEEYSRSAELDDIINQADKKLYMGKQAGRNRVVF